VGVQEHITDCTSRKLHGRALRRQPGNVKENVACQRITVGVEAAGCQSHDRVARLDAAPCDGTLPVHDAHNAPGQVVLAFRVYARHLGRLSTDKRATRRAAAVRQTFDDLHSDFRP